MFQFIIYQILFRKDVKEMAVVYATLIVKGKKDFSDVPERIQDQVKEVLIDLDLAELAQQSKISNANLKPLYGAYISPV